MDIQAFGLSVRKWISLPNFLTATFQDYQISVPSFEIWLRRPIEIRESECFYLIITADQEASERLISISLANILAGRLCRNRTHETLLAMPRKNMKAYTTEKYRRPIFPKPHVAIALLEQSRGEHAEAQCSKCETPALFPQHIYRYPRLIPIELDSEVLIAFSIDSMSANIIGNAFWPPWWCLIISVSWSWRPLDGSASRDRKESNQDWTHRLRKKHRRTKSWSHSHLPSLANLPAGRNCEC